MADREKLLQWVGIAKRDPVALPIALRKFFGHALDFAQRGEQHVAAEPVMEFGGAGVQEIVGDDADATYHAVYAVEFEYHQAR